MRLKNMAASMSSSVHTLISMINTDVSDKVILDSLKKLKTEFIQRISGCEKMIKYNGIFTLINLMERTNCTRIMDLSLSILADCSLQLEKIRLLIKENNGIKIIVNILKSQHKSVLNRAARALANIALSQENVVTIHKHNAGPILIKLLRDSNDPGTQESLTRAIRLIANNAKHQAIILKAEGLRPIILHLKSDMVSVVSQCIRAVTTLTNDCSPAAAIQVLEEGGITTLLQLTSHNKSVVKEHAFTALINLMKHSTVRASVGSSNGVSLFLEGLQHPKEKVFSLHLHALCLCCQEAVNRAKLKEMNGLKQLIKILKDNENVMHHERIILALECFYFDEDVLEQFGSCGLVQILIEKLLSIHVVQDDGNDNVVNALEECADSIPTSSKISSWPNEVPISRSSKVNSIFDIDEGDDEGVALQSSETKTCESTSAPGSECEFEKFKRKPHIYNPVSVDLATFLKNQEFGHPSSLSPSSDTCYSPCFSLSPPLYEFSPSTSPHLSPIGNPSEEWAPTDESIEDQNHALDRELTVVNDNKELEISEEISLPSESNRKRKYNDRTFSSKARKVDLSDIKSSFTFWRVEQEELIAMENHLHTTVTTSVLSGNESSSSQFIPKVTRLKGREHSLLLLLSRFSHKNELCKYLTTVDCFTAFLNVILKSKNMKCVAKCRRIVVRLLHNPHCLEDIIMMGIPTLIKQRLHDNTSLGDTPVYKPLRKYWPPVEVMEHLLHHVSLQADTVFGETLIENMIVSTLEPRRFACCKALPFICRIPKARKKILHDMDAIKLYREFLQSSQSSDIFAETVFSVRQLAHVIGIKDPVNLLRIKIEKQNKNYQMSCDYEKSLDETDFAFILDDKSKLFANRTILSQRSDVFAAMLCGNFVESNQNIIPLTEVSYKTLEFILHKLYGCSMCSVICSFGNAELEAELESTCVTTHSALASNQPDTGDCSGNKHNNNNVQTCIEAMIVCDRFLLPDIHMYVYDLVVSSVLSGRTAPSLYSFSLRFEYEELRKACIKHVLCCHDVSTAEFKDFLQSNNPSIIDEMISFILHDSS